MSLRSSGRTSAAVIALAGLLGAALARAAVPLEVYGRLPQIEDVSLSPDGSQIAFVRTDGDTRIIWVGPLADPKKAFPLKVGDQKLRGITWADNSHVLLSLSVATTATVNISGGVFWLGGELFQLQVLDVRTRKTTIVPNVDRIDRGTGLHWLNLAAGNPMVRDVGGHTVLFIRGAYLTRQLLPALFRLDLTTGVQQLVREGTE